MPCWQPILMPTEKHDPPRSAIEPNNRPPALEPPLFVTFGSLILAVLARSLAFVFAKYAALETAGSSFIAIIFNPWYLGELAALGAQALFWIRALKFLELSVAYQAMAMVYALNLGWSWYLFNETVTLAHVIGCGLIIIGVALGTSTSERGETQI